MVIRGAVGRADLLRALAAAPPEALALDIDASGWFGYERQPATIEPLKQLASAVSARTTYNESPSGRRLPLRMPFAWSVVSREELATASAGEADPDVLRTGPIREADTERLADRCLAGGEDLVAPARLLPALRRHLGATRAGPLDLIQLIHRIAVGRVPRRLPRRALRRWHPELMVALDFSPRLWPYRADMHRLAARLQRLCGQSGVSLRVLEDGPSGPWSDWVAHFRRRQGQLPPNRSWIMPLQGAPVLIVGDLGRLVGTESDSAQAWSAFVDRLRRAQLKPLALVPLGAQQLEGELSQRLPVIRWSPDAAAHPARGHGAAMAAPAGLADLLAMIAATRRVDPPLLRAMRRLNPVAPLDAGLEGAAWCHPDVDTGFTVAIRTDRQRPYLARFKQLLPSLQSRLTDLRREHHAHLPIALTHEETLLWWAYADDRAKNSPAAMRQRAEAVTFVGQLADTLASGGKGAAEGDWAAVAQGIWRRAEGTVLPRTHPVLRRLAACLPTVRGGAMAREPEACWLVQDAAGGQLRLQAAPPGPRQIGLGESVTVDADGLNIQVDDRAERRLMARDLPADIAPLDVPATVRLATTGEVLTVAGVQRPRGAAAWACERDGIVIASPPLAGRDCRWSPERLRPTLQPATTEWTLLAQSGEFTVAASRETEGLMDLDAKVEAARKLVSLVRSGFATDGRLHPEPGTVLHPLAFTRFGLDADFGVYVDVGVVTRHGGGFQRFRWIEAGSFLMGAPEDEAEHLDREGPQHLVTISRGFWLGDTACRQDLWRAMMGENPSRFVAADRPVETVSWIDVRRFIDELASMVPGCGADLPTEAEWEYACRAGTTTAFSFGATITPDQVNYEGNYPYGEGSNGLYRGETVAVRSLPPNPWGLYEMHGNVWEWCADGLREYEASAQRDPRGPEGEETHPACRGGSWIHEARRARSAYRLADHPKSANRYQGFRVCLRSIEPGGDRARPEGPAGQAPGRRPTASPRDEAKPARESWFRRWRKKT